MFKTDIKPKTGGGSGAPQYTGFMEHIPNPNWNHWSKIKVVSIEDACWLAANVEPRKSPCGGDSQEKQLFDDIQHVISTALMLNELTIVRDGPNYGNKMVYLADFSKLVKHYGFELPSEMLELLENTQSQVNKPLEKPESLVQTTNTDDQKIKESEKTKLLMIIGLLAETLADTNPGDLRTRGSPDGNIIIGDGDMGKIGRKDLIFEIFETMKKHGFNEIYGLGKTTLQNTIGTGIKTLKDKV